MMVLLRDRSEATSRRRFSRSSRRRRASRERVLLLQAVLDGQEKLVRGERLGDVAVRALARALHGGIDGGMGGDDDGDDVGVPPARLPHQLQARHARHLEVDQEHGERPALQELLQPRLAVTGGHHVIAFRGKDLAAAFADAQLVVHHEDPRLGLRGSSEHRCVHPRSSFTRARKSLRRHRLVEERVGVHRRQVGGGARTEVEALLAGHRGDDDHRDARQARFALHGPRKAEPRVQGAHHQVGHHEPREVRRLRRPQRRQRGIRVRETGDAVALAAEDAPLQLEEVPVVVDDEDPGHDG